MQRELPRIEPLELPRVDVKVDKGERSSAEASLHVTLTNSVPEHLQRFIKAVQLRASAESASTLPQGIPLVAAPGSPLDHDDLAELEEAASELPLQPLDPPLDPSSKRSTPRPPSTHPAIAGWRRTRTPAGR